MSDTTQQPKYIRLETLRQKQVKALGGDISLFDLAANLKEIEKPLFVHKNYLSENNIVARMPDAYPFCHNHDLMPFQKPLSQFVHDFSAKGGVARFL